MWSWLVWILKIQMLLLYYIYSIETSSFWWSVFKVTRQLGRAKLSLLASFLDWQVPWLLPQYFLSSEISINRSSSKYRIEQLELHQLKHSYQICGFFEIGILSLLIRKKIIFYFWNFAWISHRRYQNFSRFLMHRPNTIAARVPK